MKILAAETELPAGPTPRVLAKHDFRLVSVNVRLHDVPANSRASVRVYKLAASENEAYVLIMASTFDFFPGTDILPHVSLPHGGSAQLFEEDVTHEYFASRDGIYYWFRFYDTGLPRDEEMRVVDEVVRRR